MLSPGDLKVKIQPSTFGGAKTAARRRIEDQYYAARYYDRRNLAKRMQWYTTGFEQRVWRSLEVSWRDPMRSEDLQMVPLGNLETTDDFEELAVRVLFDCDRTRSVAYIPLLRRLLAIDPKNYRLLKARYRSCFQVGSDGPAASTFFVDRARKIRPKDPETTFLLTNSYYYRIPYGVGDMEENYRKFLYWERLGKNITQESNSEAAQEDFERLSSYAESAADIIAKQRKKGG